MFRGNTERRDFLKLGAAGAAGSLLVPGQVGYASPEPQAMPASGRFDVRDFGAKGDGNTIDTPAINKAIEAASAAGGVVHFPPGSYACFSIHLKSNVNLHLVPGATILAADTPASGGGGYDPPEPNQWDKYQDFGHSHWHNSLIWGEGISNVRIVGPGLIWGKGLSRGSGDTALAPGVGNKSISLKNCRNVTLRDFSILHGGHFGILATGVDNLTIDNLLIDTNRDGIDVDCCRNVRISNCSVNSPWDDAICPKSSYGLGFARSTDNVTITNCYVTGGYEEGSLLDASFKRIGPDYKAPRNGRIKFGTESNGGFRNITVSNCVVELCRGIALESVERGDARRRLHQQHHDARTDGRSFFPALGQPHARARGSSERQPAARADQQCCGVGFESAPGGNHHGYTGTRDRRHRFQQHLACRSWRRHEGGRCCRASRD